MGQHTFFCSRSKTTNVESIWIYGIFFYLPVSDYSGMAVKTAILDADADHRSWTQNFQSKSRSDSSAMRPSTERPAHIMATWLSSASFQTSQLVHNLHQKHQFISPTSMSSFKSSKDLLKSQRISCNPVLVSDSSSLSEMNHHRMWIYQRVDPLVDLWTRKLRIMEFRTQSCKTLKKAGIISHRQPCTIACRMAHAVSPWSQPPGLDCPDGQANARFCHRNSPEHDIMKFIQVIEIW